MSPPKRPSRRQNPPRQRDYRLILGLVAITVFLVGFKPIIALTQYPALDDLSYLKITADFLGMDYPDAPPNSYPPGVALAWLPAGLVALVYSWWFQVPEATTLPMFVGLLSYGYWCASLFLLAAMIRMAAGATVSARRVVIESVLALLGVPLLYYATHRTTMVHAPEFFFALVTAFFVLKKKPLQAFSAALVLFLLRLNDMPVLLFALASAGEAAWLSTRRGRTVRIGAVLVMSAAAVYVVWLGFFAGYNRFNLVHLLTGFSLARIPVVLFSGDWGLVWTAPAWLLCLLAAAVYFKHLSLAGRFAFAWMLCELAMCFVWPGNGSDFAYRYLMGSYAGALVIAWELFRRNVPEGLKTAIRVSWAASACWLTWVTWIYKERPEFTPYQTPDRMWTHPDLMWNSFTALFSPDNFLLSWPHSAVGSIYYTVTQSQGLYALPIGINGPAFRVTTVACAMAVMFGVWLGARLYAQDTKSDVFDAD